MNSFTRGMRMGVGLVSLGWGLYRVTRGQRGTTTTAALTTGASLLAPAIAGGRNARGLFGRNAAFGGMADMLGPVWRMVGAALR